MKLEIQLNCPAIDRLCDLIEAGKLPAATISEPGEATETTAAPKPSKAAKAEQNTPAAKPAKGPKISKDAIIELARQVSKKGGPSKIRELLDGVGVTGKVSEADESDYPKMKEAFDGFLNGGAAASSEDDDI